MWGSLGPTPLAFSPAHAHPGRRANFGPSSAGTDPARLPPERRHWGRRPGSLHLSGMLLPCPAELRGGPEPTAWPGWGSGRSAGGLGLVRVGLPALAHPPTLPTPQGRAGTGGSGRCPRGPCARAGLAALPALRPPLGLPAQPPHAPASDAPPERDCDADAAAAAAAGRGQGRGGAGVRAGRAGDVGAGDVGAGGVRSPSRRPPRPVVPLVPAGPGDRGQREPGNPGDPPPELSGIPAAGSRRTRARSPGVPGPAALRSRASAPQGPGRSLGLGCPPGRGAGRRREESGSWGREETDAPETPPGLRGRWRAAGTHAPSGLGGALAKRCLDGSSPPTSGRIPEFLSSSWNHS